MTLPASVESYLVRQSVRYGVISHAHTSDSAHTARAAHVPGDSLAKSVLLEDGGGYLMVVIPSTHRVDLGAVPPLGQAFGIEAIVDESLFDRDDIYFESGDHSDVVHVTCADFRKLMADAPRGRFSHRVGRRVAELR